MNKTLLLIIIFAVLSFWVNAQKELIIYDTYENYLNNTGITYKGEYVYSSSSELFKKRIIRFNNKNKKTTKEKNKISINCPDIWGFKLNDILFRIHHNYDPSPMCVVNQGELIYYEHGKGHLEALSNKKKVGLIDNHWGKQAYISKDMNSKMISISDSKTKHRKTELSNFVQENPEYNSFFDCLNKNSDLKVIRKCYETFFKVKLIKRKVNY